METQLWPYNGRAGHLPLHVVFVAQTLGVTDIILTLLIAYKTDAWAYTLYTA